MRERSHRIGFRRSGITVFLIICLAISCLVVLNAELGKSLGCLATGQDNLAYIGNPFNCDPISNVDLKYSLSRSQSINWNKYMKIFNRNHTKNSLIIAHWNVGPAYLKNKIEEIEACIELEDSDIIGISEANFNSKDPIH